MNNLQLVHQNHRVLVPWERAGEPAPQLQTVVLNFQLDFEFSNCKILSLN